MKILIIDNQQLTIKSLIFALGNYKEIYMKKTILTALCMVAVATAQAQINIGKMAVPLPKAYKHFPLAMRMLKSYPKNL